MTEIVSIWLALILAGAAVMKAWRSKSSAAALATYGIAGRRAQLAGTWLLVALELGSACALAAGASWAPAAVAGLLLVFVAATLAALLAGRAGRPCACFAGSSRLGWSSPIRSLVLALAAGVVGAGWLGDAPLGYQRWMTLALSMSIVASLALGVAVLALAREVAVLRLGAGGQGALEIPEEGPQLGEHQAWAEQVAMHPRAILRLAVFASEGCPLCAQVRPAVEHVAADPLLAVRSFDEVTDSAVWAQAAVPGSPFAVVCSRDGVALAKGTFNSLGQLESVLATARFRERGVPVAA